MQQLRSAVGLWDVETTQYADDGAVARVACGNYRFDWVVPDRVLAGRSDIPDANWKPGHHQVFRRAAPDSTRSAGGLKYRRRQQPYVPLT